ncbi:MAG: hypothetical protein WA005_05545 [Candidatus Binataceae bacterium]
MKSIDKFRDEVWKEVESATAAKDEEGAAERASFFSAIARELDQKVKELVARVEARLNGNRAAPDSHGNGGSAPDSQRIRTGTLKGQDYTGKRLKAYVLNGHPTEVPLWKEALISLSNQLRKKHGKDFDETVVKFGGRKRRYFSFSRKDLKYAHELGGGLFVETNLNTNLLVKICFDMVAELEPHGDLSFETS